MICAAASAPVMAGATEPVLYDSIPATWTYEPQVTTEAASEQRWWQVFGDETLTGLIARAQENSLDLRVTMRRIEMARQQWLEARSGWLPTLGLNAGWNRERSSGAIRPGGTPENMSYFQLGLNFSWEIDVFGRVAAQSKEMKAAYKASRADYDAAMITLAANIATAYVNLRLAQAEIAVAQYQIESQEKINAITQARYECGLSSKLDVAQSLSVLYSTRATLPTLRSQESAYIHSLATLIGVYPDKLEYLRAEPAKLPNPFVMTDPGVPADLLRRRPDILAAEYGVAQYASALGVARKDFLPVLALTGSVGTSARRLDKLFTKDSFTWSVAPQLSWTIFEGMARKYRVAEAKEQMLTAIDQYNLTLMNAVTEADSAIESYRYALERIGLIQKVCDESRESLELALDRYKKGLSAFTDVMNSQLSLLEYENTLLEAKAEALSAAVNVYRSVAGSPLPD